MQSFTRTVTGQCLPFYAVVPQKQHK